MVLLLSAFVVLPVGKSGVYIVLLPLLNPTTQNNH
jgi:hypothetical protein